MVITSLFRAGSLPEKTPTYFGIRLDSDVLWLPGDSSTTGYCHVTGKVVICLNQALCVKDMKLHFEGRRYMNWDRNFPNFQSSHQHMPFWERLFMYQTWNFLHSKGTSSRTTLAPGNHEFPFTFCLSNNTPDTIEGLGDCRVKYHLKATLGTAGGRRIEADTQVRVRRMYRSLLVPEPKMLQDIWPQKIIYRVSLPFQAYTFGSVIPIKYQFIPLRKGLQIASIHSEVKETHKALQPSLSTRSRIVAKDDDDSSDWDDFRAVSDDEGCWYSTTRFLRLPNDPKECLQSLTTNFLHIEHTLSTQIKLLNPDGHHSAVFLDIPITIHFALPHLPEDPFVSSLLQALREIDESCDQPLPCYDTYALDQKADDILSVAGGDAEGLPEPPNYDQLGNISKPPSYATAVLSAASIPVPFNEAYV
ncbi:hypothetical protein AbraIFM66951_002306 [Aspergillus brasiliensis]|uniref:Arrestin C-terminal-like domain-containing protein n=1 Tax=Aspergillus brasiliensis TaxID=319629 RepID=A0A9W5YUK6_9EURO|nr:hypothetical protein AbraCBS73388_011039 [Aspergillus brasiliensis]GKZ42615.1 hypothetical protein AbraIFM66951_002306 [Aspergillus brasiliensis]